MRQIYLFIYYDIVHVVKYAKKKRENNKKKAIKAVKQLSGGLLNN